MGARPAKGDHGACGRAGPVLSIGKGSQLYGVEAGEAGAGHGNYLLF